MTFGGKTKTKAEQARFSAIKAGPCLACLHDGVDVSGQGLVEVHHLRGKKRHDLTIGLCLWHHRAVLYYEKTHAEMRLWIGPSLAEGSKPFHQKFGSDEYLLFMQNDILGEG